MMILASQSRNLSPQDVLSHPLGPIPWSLATPEGNKRTTSKSVLGNELVKNSVAPATLPRPSACVVDGMVLVQKIQGNKKTFGAIADAVLNMAFREAEGSDRIDIVFDVYKTLSIKNAERQSRNIVDSIVYKSITAGQEVKQWANFKNNSTNKTNLIRFMISHWKSDNSLCKHKLCETGVTLYVTCDEKCFMITSDKVEIVPELYSSQEEADTRIMLHLSHISRFNYKSAIVASIDTDVRLLCIAFIEQFSMKVFQKSGTENRVKYVNINDVHNLLGNDVCQALLGMHAFTGCDSVSCFAGKGKLSALKLLRKHKEYRDLFNQFGTSWDLTEEIFLKIQAFTCELYGAKK